MSFIAAAQQDESSIVKNTTFWPDINTSVLRQSMRLDGTVTEVRLVDAVINAAMQVNQDLSEWRAAHCAAGFDSLINVPSDKINGESIYKQLYLRAVYCTTKANLIERYIDFDSTAKGGQADDLTASAVIYLRRDARFAIRDILGASHGTVELI
ncbi:MAG: head completion/stabilization protein [Enterovibrio sp.]